MAPPRGVLPIAPKNKACANNNGPPREIGLSNSSQSSIFLVANLDPVKFFLTEDTQLAGLEHWYWEGVEVPTAGLSVPGGMFSVNASAHQLYLQ
jgi:hypothetical protein